MPQLETAIVGHNNTKAAVTGQQELLVRINSVNPNNLTTQDVNIVGNQIGGKITPGIIVSTGEAAALLNTDVYSISFASNGTADALISFDGGVNYVGLPTGTTINMDAGVLGNRYLSNTFGYDTATNAGASLIITFNVV